MINDQQRRTFRILMISPMVPWPANDGGRIGILNMVHYLQRGGHEISFVAPRSRANDSVSFRRTVDLHLIDLNPDSRLSGRLRSAMGSLPYAAERFFSPAAVRQVSSFMRSRKFDALHAEHLYVMRLGTMLKREFGLPLVLHQHNLESEIIERFSRNRANPLVRMYARHEFRKTLSFESEMIRQADLVFPVTEEDKRKLLALAPNTHFVVLPHGVDLEALRFGHRYIADRLLFLTNFDWLPNRESFDYYCREIHPRLTDLIPSMKTVVVGKRQEAIDTEQLPQGFEFRGFLPDLNDASSLASIAIVPLRIGSGVRVKILELMALGIVVVATRLGAEGIAARHGEHLIVADEPDRIVREIQRLLDHRDELQRIAVAARKFVETHHSERAIGSIVNSSYQSLLHTQVPPERDAQIRPGS